MIFSVVCRALFSDICAPFVPGSSAARHFSPERCGSGIDTPAAGNASLFARRTAEGGVRAIRNRAGISRPIGVCPPRILGHRTGCGTTVAGETFLIEQPS